MQNIAAGEDLLTNKAQLMQIFESGFKSTQKTGLEFEKLPVYSDSKKAVCYEDIALFLKNFKDDSWTEITEDGNLIGLKSDFGHISLEPGCQFELSLNPLDSIHQIKEIIDAYNSKTALIAKKSGISWLGYGLQPVSIYNEIGVLPKKRYQFMSEYLPSVAGMPLVMMRETAGIQVGIDYKNEQDAIGKLSLALKLSPIVSGIFANSPIRASKLSGYKSFRAKSWLDTDNNRCGLVSKKLFDNIDFSFEDYAQILLDVPVIFIKREERYFSAYNLTFRKFMSDGFEGFYPTVQDWHTHLSLYFPDARLKSYVEIRNHDSQKSDLAMAIPAFWKGIMYNNNAIEAVKDILDAFNYEDFELMRQETPKRGLDFSVKNHKLADLAEELINISVYGLEQADLGEEIYLFPIQELVEKGLTPADIIIKNWENDGIESLYGLVEASLLT